MIVIALEFEKVCELCLIVPSVGPMKQKTRAVAAGAAPVSAATQKRAAPICWTPSTKRTLTDCPGPNGVPAVIAPTDSDPLNPDPFG